MPLNRQTHTSVPSSQLAAGLRIYEFPRTRGYKIVTFALSPKDYYYELKLGKSLYRIDKIEGPAIEDLAVWAHNFAIGAPSRQLGQFYVVSSMKKKEIEIWKENLLPDFEKLIPNPI
ncbi:MAG: hypothetical protein ACRD5J_15275, partial [Nitrososphaeraceae archaeon]